jgi:uncharacterized protein (DUF1330 family)
MGVNMNPTYVVGHITVTNPDGYAQYSAAVPQTIADFGGRYLVRGGDAQVLEGSGLGQRHVVLVFPSRAQAEAWYHSAAYQAIIGHRQANSTGQLVMVEGMPTP